MSGIVAQLNCRILLISALLCCPISTYACSFPNPHVNIDTLKNSTSVKLTALSLKRESLMVANKDVPFFLEYGQNARVVDTLMDSSIVWTDGYIWANNSFWSTEIDIERHRVVIFHGNANDEVSIPMNVIDWVRTTVEEDKAQKAQKWCRDMMVLSFVGTGLLGALIIYAAN